MIRVLALIFGPMWLWVASNEAACGRPGTASAAVFVGVGVLVLGFFGTREARS